MKILEDRLNTLLERREVAADFGEVAGRLTRQEAVKQVAEKLKIENEKVVLIRLKAGAGRSRMEGVFYVYEDASNARKSLPHHYFDRLLPKEERKKRLEEKRKAKKPSPTKK